MIRLLRSIIALALVGVTTTLAASSGLEIDVIFPISNVTYNITESLPIVFAIQNLPAAATLGPFQFYWNIMPYGRVGEEPSPSGVSNDKWIKFFTTDVTTEPYIIINQTNVIEWEFGPFYPLGSVYALQWAILWDSSIKSCNDDVLRAGGNIFFNVDERGIEPDLGVLTGQCPQLGGAYKIEKVAKNSTCSAMVTDGGAGDSCAITLDKPMVESISSTVQSLISASKAAASPSPTATKPADNIAVGSDVPLAFALVAALLGSLQMYL